MDNTGAPVADVTAQDYVDAIKYQLTPEYESGIVQNLFGVIANAKEYYNGLVYNGGADDDGVVWNAIDFSEVGVKAVDDHTLTYTLETEVPYFLSSLAYIVYMPAMGLSWRNLARRLQRMRIRCTTMALTICQNFLLRSAGFTKRIR